ncbi:helix-turn-helix transcriptional regulator [Staphylococcus aureus]|uniref:helix-turn-helix domain-containing protein n=1 Tax=Staphylococcus aureus TaxID=1280 RepID=UPI00263F4BA4|nr:helix-turn-helix transcriptional regulator [Staphylococcus aureus]MDN5236659.1 helix-turn-helix transcriptional regulator [Staphylococcus aureus]MDN5239051.1 helix-turn-helix transcriptional regulator [Staphylococcus aureus]MDV5917557.1 helix-turn-helix transcriptional regulator [Staphylococcus aureus]MDV5923389.1 helix-turn-helix transcriptional regulator [Staphylococcus aureus]MDV5939280.1 helix-turn-helix transcriptional regulator [Staphylococcus aureus]
MPRPSLSYHEKILRKTISKNLKQLSEGKTQAEISQHTNIPTSTLSGYFAERSTINPENTEKLATFFNVSLEKIDPRFSRNMLFLEDSDDEEYSLTVEILDMIEQLNKENKYKAFINTQKLLINQEKTN